MQLTRSLHRNAQQDPDGIATVFGDRQRTWSECRARVAALAAGLRGLGVQPGDRVGMLALNSDRYHEYLLATWWLGAVVNPLNTRWSATELVYGLNDSGTSVLLVDDAFASLLPELLAGAPDLRAVVHCGEGTPPEGTTAYESLLTHGEVDDARVGGETLAGIFYTGGTTGFPKGVVLTHANLVASALGSLASGFFVTPGARLLHVAPMFHLADLAFWTARNVIGGTHVMLPGFTPEAVLGAISTHDVADVLLVPTMIQMLVDCPALPEHDLSSLKRIAYGASPISEGVLQRTMERLPGVALVQAYGMTELSPVATMLSPEEHLVPALRRSAGRAAPHAEVRIVDQQGRPVPVGTVGEIVVSGPNVMVGYWNRPEETAAALVDGWMHTGDGGRMDEDGYVFVVDRIKDMIVTGGENVYSAEVENAVSQHPDVVACAVIGVPDPEWGERVHAVVVVRPGTEVTLEELRKHTKAAIAGYKAPRSMEVVDALPVSAAGKVLKTELRARHWEGGERGVS